MKLVNVMLVCTVVALISGSAAAQYGYELGPEFSNNFRTNVDIFFPDDAVPPVEEITEFFLDELKLSQTGGVWSPDGEWIAVSPTIGGLFLIPADGGEPESVLDDMEEMYDWGDGFWHAMRIGSICGFSPDGSEIIYKQTLIVDPDEVEVTVEEMGGGTSTHISMHDGAT